MGNLPSLARQWIRRLSNIVVAAGRAVCGAAARFANMLPSPGSEELQVAAKSVRNGWTSPSLIYRNRACWTSNENRRDASRYDRTGSSTAGSVMASSRWTCFWPRSRFFSAFASHAESTGRFSHPGLRHRSSQGAKKILSIFSTPFSRETPIAM